MNTLHSLGKEFTLFAVLTWLIASDLYDDAKLLIAENMNYPDECVRQRLQTISRCLTFGDNFKALGVADDAAKSWHEVRHKMKEGE